MMIHLGDVVVARRGEDQLSAQECIVDRIEPGRWRLVPVDPTLRPRYAIREPVLVRTAEAQEVRTTVLAAIDSRLDPQAALRCWSLLRQAVRHAQDPADELALLELALRQVTP